MADWQIHPSTDAEAKAGLASQARQRRVCLVLSADASRRAKLATAAEQAGWQTIACGSARQGAEVIRRARLQLTIVDLQCTTGAAETALRDLTKQLASMPDLLLVVCSASGSPADEIWARQLGVWLYLPGLDIEKDLDIVCREAIEIASRRTETDPGPPTQRAAPSHPPHEPKGKQRSI